MDFKIDCKIKRIYHIKKIQYIRSDESHIVLEVTNQYDSYPLVISYVKLFKELSYYMDFSIDSYNDYNILDMVNYLLERANDYLLKRIALSFNGSDCQVLKVDAYGD